jgi:hypothetical protein
LSGINSILEAGVAIASNLLDSVKSTVTYEAFLSEDGQGTVNLSPPVSVRCFVKRERKQMVADSGGVATITAILTFVDPIADVDPRSKFTLADGSTAPIVKVGGTIDPSTLKPYATRVWLGSINRGSNEQ